MDKAARASLLFIAFVLGSWVLYWLRDILAPFALAVFFWLIIDAFARWLDEKLTFLPYIATLTIAIMIVAAALVGIGVIIADTAIDIAHEAPRYQHRLAEIINPVLERFGDGSWESLNERFGLQGKLQTLLGGIAASIQNVMSSFAFIAIYVAFLFAAQNSFPKKMDDLFPDTDKRARAALVMERIRESIEKYLGVQTLMSLIMTVLSYGVMQAFGLDNALFWALVIFILNYIPVVGSVLAGILPAMFALVQFPSLSMVGIMAALLFAVQFVISNTLQPKMMGESMNMSALVVILSLVLWQAMWGGVGAFLSAPLTVIIMIILAQFPTTRWIAVLLSADGNPDVKPKTVIPSM
ncbi:MAG TPA: AI-2E family transporter [Hellea balneolensis]|uniref:AI-2E family transporter n=1 Tax=Hellea balneolensis TaxID=287478 RepID=A0A7C5LYM1_9PROT|nr:AI-2E family transporter [Hellea balneolensis]